MVHQQGLSAAWVDMLHLVAAVAGGIMTAARPELPYPCCSMAKTWDESSQRGK